MGYTTAFTRPLIGLGVSSIGDAGDAFAQNEKDLQRYQERVAAGELPIQRGHLLDAEDLVLRRHILRLMTRLETHWDQPPDYTDYVDDGGRAARGAGGRRTGGAAAASCRVTEKRTRLPAQHLHGVRCAPGAAHAREGAVQPHGVIGRDGWMRAGCTVRTA